jgi:hypothetical protein
MRQFFILLALVLGANIVMAAAAPQAKAAAGIDGFIWGNGGATQAVGARVEVVNTSTGRVVWTGYANRSNPAFYGLRNYFSTGPLPKGTYRVRATWQGQSGSACCALIDGWPTPSYFVRMNVNTRR